METLNDFLKRKVSETTKKMVDAMQILPDGTVVQGESISQILKDFTKEREAYQRKIKIHNATNETHE